MINQQGDLTKEYCLVTTSDERFWDAEAPLLFMDAGCCKYSQRKNLSDREYIIYDSHWEDYDKYSKALNYLLDVRTRVINSLRENINSIHKVDYDGKSIEILLGWWIDRGISYYYYKYNAIREISEKYKVFCIGGEDIGTLLANGTREFFDIAGNSDEYNAVIGARICARSELDVRSVYKNIKSMYVTPSQGEESKREKLSRIAELMSSKGEMVDYNLTFYPGRGKFVKLLLTRKISLKYGNSVRINYDKYQKNCELRQRLLEDFECTNDFEEALVEFIREEIPKSYIEAFGELREVSRRYFGKKKFFLTHNAWYTDEIAKSYLASERGNGLKLLGIQHGGTDIFNNSFGCCFDTECTDVYYSWGWNKELTNCEVRPMPSIKLSSEECIIHDEEVVKKGIVYVGTCEPRYIYSFRYPHQLMMGKYVDEQVRLISELRKNGIEFRARLYTNDYGWDIKNRIENLDVDVEDWRVSWEDSCRKAQLCIFDMIMTTWTEAYIAGTPIIFIVNPMFENYLDTYKENIEALIECGIYHRTLEEAIEYILEIDDFEIWWKNTKRQQIIDDFAKNFALASKNYRDEWCKEINRKINKKEW